MALSTGSSKVPVRADINVTPMIDVMLVLLIIFMIVTPAITAGFQAVIPRAQNAEKREEDQGEIRLGIDRNGKYYLDMLGPDGRYTGPRLIPDGALQDRLTQIYAARSKDKILFLRRTRASTSRTCRPRSRPRARPGSGWSAPLPSKSASCATLEGTDPWRWVLAAAAAG